MNAKVWELVTTDGKSVYHGMPEGFALCDPTIISQGTERLTEAKVNASSEDAGKCVKCSLDCYTAARKTTTKTTTRGKTMAAKSTEKATATAEVKYDVTTPEGAAAIDTIKANAERIGTLRGEGKIEAAIELLSETETMVKRLSGKGVAGVRATLNKALDEATKIEVPAESSTEIVLPSDYKEIEGVSALVDEGAKKIREGIAVGLKMVDIARTVGEIQLAQRLKITDPKTGLPDLNADTKPAKDASKATYAVVLAEIAADDVDAKAMHASIQKATQNRRSDVLVKFLRDLDSVQTPEEMRTVFPDIQVADTKGAEESYTEAVYAMYAAKGIELPRKGRTELAAEKAREKAALAARAAERALESGQGDGADGEGSDEGAGEEEPEEIADPTQYATAYAAKIKRANKGVRVDVFNEIDEDEKGKIKKALEAELRVLKDILAELV